MGQGCINIRQIRDWLESNGYNAPIEVEIFSEEFWKQDQLQYIERIKQAYLDHV